ncbi:ATP-binding protein [Zoogloea dura]|jgi:signal transduction histidine kinase|uniref:histidine kinase n=1 Tax=Zoogloea dura TaxID=2728840 RepID=A0A848G7T3_9RHOO|nr:ATP-binding protein [Zoogloea dura]NML27314.1 ATP-binding protein [Zoogloea dura]
MTAPGTAASGPPPERARHAGSLRVRLFAATVMGLAVALALAGVVLHGLFREHVLLQFQIGLGQQLDQLTARLGVDAQGRPAIDPQALSDPRWQQPYSGLYWQIDEVAPDGRGHTAVRRSRSLWDDQLVVPGDGLVDGALHVHEVPGPRDSQLLLLERTVRPAEQPEARWRLLVGADLKDTRAAVERFGQVLGVSLAILFALLVLAAVAQLWVGLRPLRRLQGDLQALQEARATTLGGPYPSEIQPLVDDFNRVLEQNHCVVERARTQAGNLAHALKTPLAVLDQAAARARSGPEAALARLVGEQVGLARRQVDWHLARARMSATRRLPGQRCAVPACVQGLVRVMEKVHADRGLVIRVEDAPAVYFAGEEQDLQEMLGNLLDNACKWARSRVGVRITRDEQAQPARLSVHIEDDGPGIADARMTEVLARGARLDESVPGSGLGLAIVQELAGLYGGSLQLRRGPAGGLAVVLELPAV